MNQPKVREILKTHLIPSANYIYGFANLTGLLSDRFRAYTHGISIGRRLDDGIVNGIMNAPTMEYLSHYSEINKELLLICEQISLDLQAIGIRAFPVSPTVTGDPREFDTLMPDLRYDVSHKMVATRAGLGWIGKTDLCCCLPCQKWKS
jgi:epoxyqueuosine reductase